jgi:O-antigen/teichoic acid export membrane protein
MSNRLPANKAKLLNLAALITSYGFGQGSIFLAQTWLVAQGKLDLLALFGTHFAFAVFGVIVVEAGSITILARHAASLEHGEESAATLWRTFWEVSAFRAALAVLVIAAGAGFALAADEPFTHAYALYAMPAFALWAVNGAGLLDGLKLSGISGASGSFAYVASAFALLFAQELDPARAGALLGAAFSAGYLLTVLVQFAALHAVGWRARFERPSMAGVRIAGRDGIALLGSNLPGQVYFRIQLLLSSAWLGPAPTALFVYVKQIVAAGTQLVGFIRRVEFPTLVQRLAQEQASPARATWHEQRLGSYLAFAASLCVLVAGIALAALADGVPGELGLYFAAFAPSLAATAVFLAFSQGLAALGQYGALSLRTLVSAAVGVAVSLALTRTAGVYAFAIADLVSATAGIAWVLYALRRR